MAPVKPGSYIFDPKSITKMRDKLKLTQKQMGEQLGIPVNTLSRWETGAATPDANSLAAIYSLAVSQGYTPGFFRKEKAAQTVKVKRRRAVVMLDFQNLGVREKKIQQFTDWIVNQISNMFIFEEPQLLKAFARPDQQAAVNELKKLKWRVKTDNTNLDQEIVQQSKADCGADPARMVLFLLSKDGDFVELVADLRLKGVLVYVVGPKDSSQKLVKAVGKEHWIQLPSL